MRRQIISESLDIHYLISSILKYDYYIEGIYECEIPSVKSCTQSNEKIIGVSPRECVHIIDLNTRSGLFSNKCLPIKADNVGVLSSGAIITFSYKTFYIWELSNLRTPIDSGFFDIKDGMYRVFVLRDTFVTIRSTTYGAELLQQWNLEGECILEYKKNAHITCIIELPNGRIVIGLPSGIIKILSQPVRLKGHIEFIICLVVVGKYFVSASNDGTIRVWTYEGACHTTIHYRCYALKTIDTYTFASISQDGIKVWDIQGYCLRTLTGSKIAVLPNNNLVALENNMVRIWNEEKIERQWIVEEGSAIHVSGARILINGKNSLSVWK